MYAGARANHEPKITYISSRQNVVAPLLRARTVKIKTGQYSFVREIEEIEPTMMTTLTFDTLSPRRSKLIRWEEIYQLLVALKWLYSLTCVTSETTIQDKYEYEYSTSMPSLPLAIQAIVAFALLVAWQLPVVLARLNVDRELRRNWQHWSTGQAFLIVSYILPIQLCVALLLIAAALFYYLQVYQTRYFLQHFGAFLRPQETSGKQLSGAFYFLLGTGVTAYLFPVDTARFALQCLSTVDPVAGFVGRSVPSRNINASTTLAGTMAGWCTACVIGYIYLQPDWSKILLGATTCCIVEASPSGNDNLWIPVITSIVMERNIQIQ